MFNIIKVTNGPVSTNTYLVGDETCYIIDPSDDIKRIEQQISANFKGVKAILLTHGHFDHVGGVDYFVNKYNVDVYMDLNDLVLLDQDLMFKYGFKEFFRPVNSEIKDIFLLADKNIIIYESKGHTKGSVLIYFKKENILFSGDTLFKNCIGRTDLPTASDKDMKESLKLIKSLDESIVVYPGHGSKTTLKEEFLNNDYLKFI